MSVGRLMNINNEFFNIGIHVKLIYIKFIFYKNQSFILIFYLYLDTILPVLGT